MKILLDYTLDELRQQLELPSFRVKQIYKWLTLYKDFSEMTDLSKPLRAQLESTYVARPLEIVEVLTAKDGTRKYLYRLQDGNLIEGVLMRYKYGNTLCVSTQVGCRMGCSFCASGLQGLLRNLSSGEILGQVLAVNAYEGGDIQRRAVTNLVLMGMGEPLDNYDQVLRFLKLVSSEDGLNVSMRNISLSTCGLADRIRDFADEKTGVNLTISLHAATDEHRRAIMPIAKRYDIKSLIEAARYYFEQTGRRVIFEYVLIANQNMSDADGAALIRLMKGFPTHVNLIMLNGSVSDRNRAATRAQAEAFLKKLTDAGVSATIRRSMGSDIEGACGQLRRKHMGDQI